MEENNPQTNNKDNIKTVRTYMSDMADTVRENEISVIKVALAEQNKHEREDLYREAEGTPVKKVLFIVGGVILLLGAIYGSYFIFNENAKKNAIQPATIREDSIISYDQSSSILVTDVDNIVNKIKLSVNEKSGQTSSESLKQIYVEKEVSGIKEKVSMTDFISSINFSGPSSLVRSLSDSYMIGTYTKNLNETINTENQKPSLFLIFQSKDYEFTYAGMLAWENTMAGNMRSLFDLNTNESILKINERKWRDVIINNKDARVLLDDQNTPILYYIFVDKTNLVITDNESTIKEIMKRLIIKNIKPL